MNSVIKVDRRDFLKTTATSAVGLVVGFYLAPRTKLVAQQAEVAEAAMNAFIHIGADDTVTFFIHKSEMGQGTVTSLSMLLAEELECDWTKIETRFPGVDRAYGFNQGVYGSASVRSSWGTLRRAGATAREMLVQAAANQWGVEKSVCKVENGAVINTTNDARLTFGQLAEAAAKLDAPANVTLKNPDQFKIIGNSTKRLDTPEKVNGSSVFGIDFTVEGMVHASIERCPVIGGSVESFDGAAAKATPGVIDVVQVASGIAVIAENTWSAMQGRYALNITWNEGANANLTSAQITQGMIDAAGTPGRERRNEGDAVAALEAATKKVEADYEVPFLAHAPMEPSCCTAHVREDECDVWAPTQMQSQSRSTVARITGLPQDKVYIHTTMLGGGFGRRLATDFVEDAVHVSKAIGKPVKVTWTREDETRQSQYRTAAMARFEGGVNAEGWPVAWKNRIVCQFGNGGVDGAADIPYAIPNFYVDSQAPGHGMPTTYWRSVNHSQNTFFAESFLDELAALGGKDPFELRRRLLQNSPKHLHVLELAAEKAGWGEPLPEGRGRGIAIVDAFGSHIAQVVEASVGNQGQVRVHRVVVAVDCGRVVNPSGVIQMAEGGVVFGLTAALKGQITVDRGRVQQSNFGDYDLLRMDEMPEIEVHLVDSEENPGGMGEPAVPPAAPALCNAIFAATGKRIRKLPISAEQLRA